MYEKFGRLLCMMDDCLIEAEVREFIEDYMGYCAQKARRVMISEHTSTYDLTPYYEILEARLRLVGHWRAGVWRSEIARYRNKAYRLPSIPIPPIAVVGGI